MFRYIKKCTRLTLIVVLISTIMLPASAYASASSVSQNTSSYATSFFSSLAGEISSLFQKDKTTYYYNDTKTVSNSWFSWLKGNDIKNWWEDKKDDSFMLWEKYYCY
ncbi:hypothetical protein [Paenibacillus wynnii]|uniref:hypothetical protein n=1 Tax=Paenibacillus wynnii TaxID=268407 RepID=UPI002793D987|nr:hypothetical protein [Paenibacillus wynnii]MDQ0194128.1 hypothetical protein [Paenibacillus wynnii]